MRKTIELNTKMENTTIENSVAYNDSPRLGIISAHFMDVLLINQEFLKNVSDQYYKYIQEMEETYKTLCKSNQLKFAIRAEQNTNNIEQLQDYLSILWRSEQRFDDEKELKNFPILEKEELEQVIIPVGMNRKDVAAELLRQWEAEEKIVDKTQMFAEWHADDSLVQVMRVLNENFGWINSKTQRTMFGQQNPNIFDIKTDFDKREPCFYGNFDVLSWEGSGSVFVTGNTVGVTFSIKKRYEKKAEKFFQDVYRSLKSRSIYKGKFVCFENNKFKYFENKIDGEIILNDGEQSILDNFILKPIKSMKLLKRGVLLTGPYGTGKTETAMRIGDFANKLGYTFIYSKEENNISNMLEMSIKYAPAIIFIEDIDEFTSSTERDRGLNSILNTLDGIETKNNSIHTIMTTNNPDKIHEALRRPGRIDVVLEFKYPDSKTINKMYRHFFDGTAGCDSLDYDKITKETPNNLQGAFIKEIAKRAIWLSETEDGALTDDIVLSSIGLANMQISFMKGKQDSGNKVTFENVFYNMVKDDVESIKDDIEEIKSNF